MATVSENLEKLINIKEGIRTAISDKGVEIPETTPFTEYPEKISEISGGGTDEIFENLLSGTLTEVHSTTPIVNGRYLFDNQKQLRVADVIIPNELDNYSGYRDMFYNCISLTTAPALPALNLKSECYDEMFRNCTSLTEAPDLPATELQSMCYYYMFYNCTSLTKAPDLPATESKLSWGAEYESMFQYCTSLQKTGKIAIGGNVNNITSAMFSNCTSLRETTWTSTTPPTITTSTFYKCPSDMIIYVPDASVEKYKAASVWSERAEYIKPMSARPE